MSSNRDPRFKRTMSDQMGETRARYIYEQERDPRGRTERDGQIMSTNSGTQTYEHGHLDGQENGTAEMEGVVLNGPRDGDFYTGEIRVEIQAKRSQKPSSKPNNSSSSRRETRDGDRRAAKPSMNSRDRDSKSMFPAAPKNDPSTSHLVGQGDNYGSKSSYIPGTVSSNSGDPRDRTIVRGRNLPAAKVNRGWLGILSPGGGSSQDHTVDSLMVSLDRSQTQNAKLEQDNQTYRRMQLIYEDQENQKAAALASVARLEIENQRLLQIQKTQETQVRMAQELMLQKNKKPQGGLADEDKTIKGNFKLLQTSIKEWTKKWAHEDIKIIVDWAEPQRSQIFAHFSNAIRIDDGKLPSGFFSSESRSSRTPAICLSALLWNDLCESVFERPFCTLDANFADLNECEKRLLPQGNRALDIIYQTASICDEESAQVWRRHTLELLDPSSDRTEGSKISQQNAARRRSSAAKNLSTAFLSSTSAVLLRVLEVPDRIGQVIDSKDEELQAELENTRRLLVERANELELIFKTTLDMSARLWKQLSIVRCHRFNSLTEEGISGPFTIKSELLEAHPLHQLGCRDEEEEEEDVTRLDNHRIMMVVSPTILALGNSDGENYFQYRVWAKGVVWLEE